jgi:autonomous glycyl radical cofactor GrcA
MSIGEHPSSLKQEQAGYPVVHLSYECVMQELSREATIARYEIACSITYPTESAHLSIRVTGQQTYRNAPAREVPFTRHEAGATTYVELLEREQLEVRIVEQGGAYAKVVYAARNQTLTEQHVRGIISMLQRLEEPSDTLVDGNAFK